MRGRCGCDNPGTGRERACIEEYYKSSDCPTDMDPLGETDRCGCRCHSQQPPKDLSELTRVTGLGRTEARLVWQWLQFTQTTCHNCGDQAVCLCAPCATKSLGAVLPEAPPKKETTP